MKAKNKVLLMSVGLVLFSGMAAVGSTFAWFSAIQNASVSFNTATIETKDNNLSVVYKSSLNTGISDSVTGNSIELTGANKVTDISGDGINFYKPLWDAALDSPSARVAYDIVQVGETVADGYYIDFTLTISRSSIGTSGMKVYLGNGTEIAAVTSADSEDEQAVLGSRLAVLDSLGAVILVYAPDADGSYNYITPATGESLYSVADFDSVALTGVVNSFATYTTVTAADAGTVAIADLSTATTADVTFRAWLEGEDADTINDAIGGVFSIALKLYGLAVSV